MIGFAFEPNWDSGWQPIERLEWECWVVDPELDLALGPA